MEYDVVRSWGDSKHTERRRCGLSTMMKEADVERKIDFSFFKYSVVVDAVVVVVVVSLVADSG